MRTLAKSASLALMALGAGISILSAPTVTANVIGASSGEPFWLGMAFLIGGLAGVARDATPSLDELLEGVHAKTDALNRKHSISKQEKNSKEILRSRNAYKRRGGPLTGDDMLLGDVDYIDPSRIGERIAHYERWVSEFRTSNPGYNDDDARWLGGRIAEFYLSAADKTRAERKILLRARTLMKEDGYVPYVAQGMLSTLKQYKEKETK